MTYDLSEVKEYLRINIKKQFGALFGCNDEDWINQVTNNWFDDKNNYDGRWNVICERVPHVGKALDMAAGCGTFVLYGLNNGFDVWGIEPEPWKLEYYKRKIIASNYPRNYLKRICAAVGELLPYADETFDFITTYQTLEHVTDVGKCLEEMLRVLKYGGILYIRAPNYNSFYEPHYRVLFLPKISKKIATIYLNFLGKPTGGLNCLNFITEKDVINGITTSKYKVSIERQNDYYSTLRENRIRTIIPEIIRTRYVICFLNNIYSARMNIMKLIKFTREENNIDLWVKKYHDPKI